MFARRFPISSSIFSKVMKNQKLSICSETADLSVSKMKKKPKVSKSQVITTNPLREAMKKQNDADWFLTGKVIASEARHSNFVFSPASLNAALTMAEAASARSASEERKALSSEIATVVFADGSKKGGPKITAINGVWVEQSLPVDQLLRDLFVNDFKATYTLVDFRSKAEQVRRELNQWASDNTNGLIKDLLPPGSVESKTNQVYGNALYFKGAWEDKFNKKLTMHRDFHLLNGTSVSVPFMSMSSSYHKKHYVEAYDDFKVLKLPFRQGRDNNRSFSMHFYLPDEKHGLDNLVKKMTSTPGFLDSPTPSGKVCVGYVRIPKFKISFGFKASKEFNLVFDKDELYHKACVEIDEEGAEAAAATFLTRPVCFIQYSTNFVADHPFLFLIREDKTGTVLFAGQVFDPSKST